MPTKQAEQFMDIDILYHRDLITKKTNDINKARSVIEHHKQKIRDILFKKRGE